MSTSFQQNEKKQLQTRVYNLVKDFKNTLLPLIMGSNLSLHFLKKKSSEKGLEDLDNQTDRARKKWERLTHFMLDIDGMQDRKSMPDRQILQGEYLQPGIDNTLS